MPGDTFYSTSVFGVINVIACGVSRIGDDWVDSITYTVGNEDNPNVNTLPTEIFRKEFIPTRLSVGDYVVCRCMGKIRSVYKIANVDRDENKALGWNTNENKFSMNFDLEIAPNGSVICLDDNTNGTNEYLFVTDKIEEQLIFNHTLEQCLRKLNLIKETLSTDAELEFLNIEDLKRIYDKFDEIKDIFTSKK